MERGLTQLELREKCHVSVRTIQRIESGAVTPRLATIKILLKALGEDENQWFGPQVKVRGGLLMETFNSMWLVRTSDSALKLAFMPAWIAGIIYLLMVLMEQGLGAFSEQLNEDYFIIPAMAIVKVMAAISFFLFTRGILSLALLFEIHLLKVAAYLSMIFVPLLYFTEVAIILYTQDISGFVSTVRTLSVAPLGAISVVLGMGLLKLQDGMGRVAKIAGRLEIAFGISYMSLVLSFVGVFLLVPLLVVEIVLVSKADQLVKDGEL